MEESSIIFENVTKSFYFKWAHPTQKHANLQEPKTLKSNQLVVFKDISFEIKKGEMVAVIGLNGIGKTTLLRLISGIYKPDSGKIKISGKVAPLLQIGTGFNNELDAVENIVSYGILLGLSKSTIKSRVDKILEFAELEDFRSMKLKNFSTGMKAKLGFSTALEVDPDILLLDEVLAVGDATFRQKSHDAFLSFKKRNKTIVFTSHNMNMVKKISDRVLLINSQEIAKFGTSDEVLPRYKMIIKNHEERRKQRRQDKIEK